MVNQHQREEEDWGRERRMNESEQEDQREKGELEKGTGI